MNKDWILYNKETPRFFSKATWIPLRAYRSTQNGDIKDIGFISEIFGSGSVAFPPEHREIAEQLDWMDIGISNSVEPYAYEDGYYASIEQYQHNDKDPIGVNLVFEQPRPIVGGRLWVINPDLIAALHLVKDGNNWIRPEENFTVVAREVYDDEGNHCLIEIKREFLIDYLAARNLSLKLSYYRQRVENVLTLESSPYSNLTDKHEQCNEGRYSLLIRNLEEVFGGSWASFRVWRTDIDEEEDAPVMGPESEDNTNSETKEGYKSGYEGVRVEGEFWRNEWIDHKDQSVRVRGDANMTLPQFIVETDGTHMASSDLNSEEIGRWLWFRSEIVIELINLRGFSFKWHTAETGCIQSTSGYSTRFGINYSDLITVYAYDIARLDAWEQHRWAAHNVVPDGKVSTELFEAQVKVNPASTHAPEELFIKSMQMLEKAFYHELNIALFNQEIDESKIMHKVSRFVSKDQTSLLRLSKDLVCVFTDRLNMKELRELSINPKKKDLGSNKLLQDILAQKVGLDKAYEVFTVIVGVYDMRLGDAHPTSSKIDDALKLAGIDESKSYLRQGEQLISNYGRAIWMIGKLLFRDRWGYYEYHK